MARFPKRTVYICSAAASDMMRFLEMRRALSATDPADAEIISALVGVGKALMTLQNVSGRRQVEVTVTGVSA